MTGSVKLPEGVEMVMPGDNVAIEVELITPVAMEKTMRFAIREGGKTVGAGRIAEILDCTVIPLSSMPTGLWQSGIRSGAYGLPSNTTRQ